MADMIDIDKLVLTPEELDELFREYEKEHSYEEGTWEKAISLATVKKVVEYGDETCRDHQISNNIQRRRECKQCQQEIKQALEEG